jgi:hypothetical protein
MPKKKDNRDPRLDTEPLHFGMMTRDQQAATEAGFQRHTGGLRERAEKTVEGLKSQQERAKPSAAVTLGHRIKRLESVHDILPTKPVSIDQAADNRIGWMKRAATTERLPHESGLAGAGWYYEHHARVSSAVPDVPMHVAGRASALASPGTRPEYEVATVRAVHQADATGTVHLHPEVVAHLASKGVEVPRSAQGKVVPFRDVPTEALQHLVDPKVRAMVAPHSEGVDWTSMGGTAHPRNVSAVARTLRGEVAPDEAIPHTSAPKLSGYSKNTIESVPGGAIEGEYHSRAAHLGEVMRNETHPRQGMLDLYGLRHSTEGQLGHGHTAEDSWMQAASVSIPDEKRMKAVGDIPYQGGKQATLRSGRVVSASPDPRVRATSVYHAANNEATRRAAVKLEETHGLEYRVPTTLVQETTWTGARRAAGEDPAYNAHQRAAATQAKSSAPTEVHGQLDIFGGQSRRRDVGVHTQPLNVAQFGDEPTGKDRVKAEAAASAIQRNTMAKRRREGRSVDTSAKALGNEPYEGWG